MVVTIVLKDGCCPVVQIFPCPIAWNMWTIPGGRLQLPRTSPSKSMPGLSLEWHYSEKKSWAFSPGLIKIHWIPGHCYYRTISVIYTAISLNAESKLEDLKMVKSYCGDNSVTLTHSLQGTLVKLWKFCLICLHIVNISKCCKLF